jgi:hypothetical protein
MELIVQKLNGKMLSKKKIERQRRTGHCTNLEEDVGGEAQRLNRPVGDLVEHRLGLVVLGQINRRVRGVRLPWLHSMSHMSLPVDTSFARTNRNGKIEPKSKRARIMSRTDVP